MQEKVKKSNIYVCADCEGSGEIAGQKCKLCAGLGVVLILPDRAARRENEIYYFNEEINNLAIAQNRFQKKVRVFINGLFFIFGFVGFLCLIKTFYDLRAAGLPEYFFVFVKNEWLQVFWASAVADIYLIYRINIEAKIKHKIRRKPAIFMETDDTEEEWFDWRRLKDYKKINVSKSMDESAKIAFQEGWLVADKLKQGEFLNIHLFTALLTDNAVKMVFGRLAVDYKKMAEKVARALKQITLSGQIKIGQEMRRQVLIAYEQAYNQKKEKLGTTDLLYAAAHMPGVVAEILYEIAITEQEIDRVVEWVDLHRGLIRQYHEFRYKARFKPKREMNRTYTAIATPNLDAISRDMTLLARAGGYQPCIGREKEIADVFRVLSTEKLGAILVGLPGVGKNTIIEGIAQLMVAEDVPGILNDKRLINVSVSGLIAGASKVGEMEQRILTIMHEVVRSKNIVLIIEDIHHMVGVSAETGETMDIAEVLAEQMQAYKFFVIATTTAEYYQKYIERSSLAKTMQKILVMEPNDEEAISVLEAVALRIENKHKVFFAYQAIAESIRLSKQYLHEESLPEKAIRILEEAALAVAQKKGERAMVTAEDIAVVVSDLTKIPLKSITAEESKKLLNLEEKMHERIIGQEEAVKMIASALRRARTALRGKNRPISSFLFLGPTGVGKTEVARTLSRIYFGAERNMIRIDMSEYQASDALAKLIGDARTGTGGFLTEAVRRSPFALILLDEFEKATLDILNVFLQVLDDGRLTDANGRTIDFTNAIIIGTSNAGTEFIQDSLRQGKDINEIREALINEKLKNYFRPELLNRFDGIVVFKPLNMSQVMAIAKIFLGQLAAQLEEKGIAFEASEEAIAELSALGFDPTLGARPLRRVIQDKVEDKLASLILENKVGRRDKIIWVKGQEAEIVKAKDI